ncbi:MAG: rhodanese-like domain-containing protein [Ignavibacteria bacterium]|nr:rhodanese-like domain-containing protein [Ignavibacteria bacterium]
MSILKSFFDLSLNKKLALIAFILGVLALIAGSPYDKSKVTVDTQELAMIVDKEVDHVSVYELADWLIQGNSDFRLIDLRSEKEFNEYHIPSAENIPVAELPKSNLTRNEKIILYSEGGIHSAQAWFLLKAKDYKAVYILLGGLDEWKDKILFPKISSNATPAELAEFEKIKYISKYFGGTPQTGTTQTEVSSPKIELPKQQTPQTSGGVSAPKKKKKEGC